MDLVKMHEKNGQLEFYTKILTPHGITCIQSISIETPDLTGEHFASSCDYVTMEWTGGDGGKPQNLELFVKKLVDNEEYSKKLKEIKVFETEAGFFNDFVPVIEKLVKSRSKGQYKLDMVPKCYYADAEMTILENVAKKNYVLLDKKEKHDFEEATMVLQNLAKFHAPSYILISENFENDHAAFIKKFPFAQETLMSPDYPGLLGEFMEPYLAATIEIVKQFPSTIGHQLALNTLEPLKGNFVKDLMKFYHPAHPPATQLCFVVNHGDVWSSNLLFQKDPKTGHLTHQIFCDFQTCRTATPTLDVANYIFTSVKPSVHRQEWKKLLKIYFDSFTAHVQALNGRVTFSFKDFFNDFKSIILPPFIIGAVTSLALETVRSIGNLDEIEGDVFERLQIVASRWAAANPQEAEKLATHVGQLFVQLEEIRATLEP